MAIDTITRRVLAEAAASLDNEVPEAATVCTVTVTLNGAHGGVDVTAEMILDNGADYDKTWEVH